MQISLMVGVPSAADGVEWYRSALGAEVLWDLGSVVGLSVAGAPYGHRWLVGDRSPLGAH
jgi:PhnB protein